MVFAKRFFDVLQADATLGPDFTPSLISHGYLATMNQGRNFSYPGDGWPF